MPYVNNERYTCYGCGESILATQLHYCSGKLFKTAFVDSSAKVGVAEKEKPPIGVMPRALWEEQRVYDLIQAIYRYKQALKPVPSRWIDELKDLTKVEEPTE